MWAKSLISIGKSAYFNSKVMDSGLGKEAVALNACNAFSSFSIAR